jgi:hypothetical protein
MASGLLNLRREGRGNWGGGVATVLSQAVVNDEVKIDGPENRDTSDDRIPVSAFLLIPSYFPIP